MTPPRLRPGLIDLHAHVLAGVDDGPETIDGALELLTAMAAGGTSVVAATSHVSDRYPNGPPALRQGTERLAAAVDDRGVPVSVVAGAEIALGMAMRLDDAELRGLVLGRSTWLLVETPHARYPAGMVQLVGDLRRRGFNVVIAHPERNTFLQEDPRPLAQAVQAGALAQITGASLRGRLGRGPADASRRFIESGLAHLVASDAHDVVARPPDMGEVAELLRHRFGEDLAEAMTIGVPRAILDDAPPTDIASTFPAVPRGRRRSFLGRRR